MRPPRGRGGFRGGRDSGGFRGGRDGGGRFGSRGGGRSMENQHPAKRREEAAEGSMEEEDRISELPDPILHHILSLLPQEDAIRTCILSKSWRHLGPTRPKIEFEENSDPRKNQNFLSSLVKTIQRYDDQNLSIKEFNLQMRWSYDSKTISVLDKWIPIVLMNKGLKTFNLKAFIFSLPPVVFQAEFLEELFLTGCELNKTFNSTGEVQVLKRLRKLSLGFLRIEEETFEKVMSSCPLIQHLDLHSCSGLSTTKVKKAHNLKHFDFFGSSGYDIIDSVEINDDAPSLETIHIRYCRKLFHLNDNCFFPRLKSLYLLCVHLPTELLNNLSSKNLPCLEELELHYCSGLSEFKLSNHSIKRLIINATWDPIEFAVINAADIRYFEFTSRYLPSISFATTSRELKSRVEVCRRISDFKADVLSTWYLKLYEFLKALSQSQISLNTYFPLTDQVNLGDSYEPVVVEHLCLSEYYSSSEVPTLLNCVFRICRPSYIGLPLSAFSQKIWKPLVKKGEMRHSEFWQQDLEESSTHVSDEKRKEWRSVQGCASSNNIKTLFRLKWRDLS